MKAQEAAKESASGVSGTFSAVVDKVKIEEVEDLENIKVDLVEPKVREIVFMLACYPDIVRTVLKAYNLLRSE